MKLLSFSLLTVSTVLTSAFAQAGEEVKATEESVPPLRTWFPSDPGGFVTLGAQFSESTTGIYLDSITGLWAPQKRDAFLFLNSRYHWEDNSQFISSIGLGFRKLLPEHDVILGVNAHWDSMHGENGSDFNQLGVGAEVLTRWVDARFNYYAPEDDRVEYHRRHETSSESLLGPEFTSGRFIVRELQESSRRRSFSRYETTLEGYNGEVGFLIPGLDRYAEVRLYAGYYHYDNPFGSDFKGFKGRLEARFLPGVIADVEYWDDAALMGGHWTAGMRVSVPFSLVNLVTGRNPFEGITENFTPRRREFKERLGEMIIRSHRIQTTSSGDIPTGDVSSPNVNTVPVSSVPPPPPPTDTGAPPPPPPPPPPP